MARPRPLSPRSVRYVHAILRSAFQQAVRWRVLAQNPCLAVRLPKQQAKEMHALSGAEAAAFLSAVREAPHGALWTLLLGSGMRLGEALGLRWSDLDGETVNVRRSQTRTKAGLVFTEPKTAKSKRTIDLPRYAIEALKRHRAEQGRHAMRLGTEYDRGADLIFADPFGRPQHPNPLREREFVPLLKAAGLPPIRIHDLRHTHASLLLAAGEPVLNVSRRLGHANATLTLNTYGHCMPNADRGIAARLDAMLETGTG